MSLELVSRLDLDIVALKSPAAVEEAMVFDRKQDVLSYHILAVVSAINQ